MEGWLIVCTTSCSVVSIHPWLFWRWAVNICMLFERRAHYLEQHLILGSHHITRICMDLSSEHASPLCALSRFVSYMMIDLTFWSIEEDDFESLLFFVVYHQTSLNHLFTCSSCRPIWIALRHTMVEVTTPQPYRISPLRCGWPSCPLFRCVHIWLTIVIIFLYVFCCFIVTSVSLSLGPLSF